MNSKLSMAMRLILGLVMAVFGLNKFFMFLEMPPPPESAGAFFGAMAATGFMFGLIGFVETVAGVLLLLNKATKFALLMLFPISIGILLFHLFLDPAGGIMGYVLVLFNILLIYDNWDGYKSLFD
jgi:uncharacterized membrane protein YphA (DoxX/SURF4 family)